MTKKITPIIVIKQNCEDCSGFSFLERKWCVITDCPLWFFRLGKRYYEDNHPQKAHYNKDFVAKNQHLTASQMEKLASQDINKKNEEVKNENIR